jgi:heme-degrading monooxygenase HmoA
MITLVAEHWFKADIAKEAVKFFLANDQKLKDAGGLVSRLVLTSREDPTKITTVTTWESEEGYDRFMAELAAREANRDPDAPTYMIGEKLEGYVVNSAT